MNKHEIFDSLDALQLRSDDTVLVHSSFSSLGQKGLTGFEFLSALRSYLSSGTLILPSLTFDYVTAENPCFDVQKTQSCIGYLPEVFRTKFDVIRSLHPTHSVCAIGKYAHDITRNHMEDATPCGENSPFALLPQLDGKILMIGCGLNPNTSMHAIEELVVPTYLYGDEIEYSIIDKSRTAIDKTYRSHDFDGYVQRYDRIEALSSDDWVVVSNIYRAKSYALDAAKLWEVAHNSLNQNPLFFVDKKDKS